ncbi:hypothetical protein Tco_0800545 [Tanacetum coccineum]|uniref:Uncharacterized protein n=1 Tax=Tanacetum coccineum TaxID=301880 RepID=A0ABQ4ZWQ6_9ASTR
MERRSRAYDVTKKTSKLCFLNNPSPSHLKGRVGHLLKSFFSTLQPFKKEESGNMEMEPDSENMMMNEYLEYEAAKERQLWDDVRSRRSPINYDEADVDSFHRNKNIENMTIAEYNLYVAKQSLGMNPLSAKNVKRMGRDIVQDSIWEHDDDLEEDQEDDGNDRDTFDIWNITVEDVERIRQFFTPNVPNAIENVIQPLIPKTLLTTPPNEDYVAPATKSILDDLLQEFGDEILNVTMVNERAKCNLAKDIEELKRLLAKEPQLSLEGDEIQGLHDSFYVVK